MSLQIRGFSPGLFNGDGLTTYGCCFKCAKDNATARFLPLENKCSWIRDVDRRTGGKLERRAKTGDKGIAGRVYLRFKETIQSFKEGGLSKCKLSHEGFLSALQ